MVHRASRKTLDPVRFEGGQSRREPFENFAQPGQAAPRLDIRGAGGPERREVTQHHVVDRQALPTRLAEPRRGGREPDLPAALPQRPRGHLHQRQQAARGLGQRRRWDVGPLPGQSGTHFGRRQRLGIEKAPGGLDNSGHVDVGERFGMHRARQPAIKNRLDQRTQPVAVGGADQMDGAAHQHDANRLAVGEQAGELVAGEAVEPAPQSVVGRERRLRLHADKVLDRVERAHRRARQQELTSQRRPVQCPQRQGQLGSAASNNSCSAIQCRSAASLSYGGLSGTAKPCAAGIELDRVRDARGGQRLVEGLGVVGGEAAVVLGAADVDRRRSSGRRAGAGCLGSSVTRPPPWNEPAAPTRSGCRPATITDVRPPMQ